MSSKTLSEKLQQESRKNRAKILFCKIAKRIFTKKLFWLLLIGASCVVLKSKRAKSKQPLSDAEYFFLKRCKILLRGTRAHLTSGKDVRIFIRLLIPLKPMPVFKDSLLRDLAISTTMSGAAIFAIAGLYQYFKE